METNNMTVISWQYHSMVVKALMICGLTSQQQVLESRMGQT